MGAGGFLGAVLRYRTGETAARLWPASAVPVGTLAVAPHVGATPVAVFAGYQAARLAG